MLKEKLNKTRYYSYLFAVTNCILGCSLGFFYGHVTLSTLVVAITIVLSGFGVQSLCNSSIDYSRAYRKHERDKKEGIISPLMVGEFPVSALRKRMAIVTMLTTICGAIAVYLSLGSNIQILSWFIFLSVVSVLLSLFYTTSSVFVYKGIAAISIFLFFGFVSVIGPQFMIVAASHETIDLYPDTIMLAISSSISSLMVLYGRTMRSFFTESKIHNKKAKSLIVHFGYNFTSAYLVGLLALNIFFSFTACLYSHKTIECIFLLITYIPMILIVYSIISHLKYTTYVKIKFNQLMLCCCVNNLVWVLILIVDYTLFY